MSNERAPSGEAEAGDAAFDPRQFSDAAAAARYRRRRRAETRFRLYGLAAIAFAATSLIVLVSSVLLQSVSALFVHHLVLEVEVPAEDARASADPAALLRQAVASEFPEIRDRASLRALNRLTHSLNAVRLSDALERATGQGRGQIRFVSPLSDDLDLFLKGRVYPRVERVGGAPLRLDATTGAVTLTIAAEDVSAVRARLQTRLEALARRLDAELEGRERDRARVAALLAEAENADDADAVQAQRRALAVADVMLTSVTARRDAASTQAQAPMDAGLDLTDTLPSVLVVVNGGVVKLEQLTPDGARGRVLAPLNTADPAPARSWRIVQITTPEADRARSKFNDAEAAFALVLEERGVVRRGFNSIFFTAATSNEPELAGVAGALIGSLWTMLVTMALAVPIGVGAAIYLEEFAPRNRFTALVEININNLAAVPSIVFGLLGAAVLLNFFGQNLGLSDVFGRGFPLVGGVVLALMTLPTIIIATRAALRAVPAGVRDGALSVGASRMEMVKDHVLPLAAPGILTGAIIGLAQALGETAPLLLVGMAAFVAELPDGPTSTATVMPVQIFQWANKAERAFSPLAAAAILVLLSVMIAMNAIAVWLRRRYERRW